MGKMDASLVAPAGWADMFADQAGVEQRAWDIGAPFLLLDDARLGKRSWLFHNPIEIFSAHTVAQVNSALIRVRDALAAGHYCAGFLSYEGASAFDERQLQAPGPVGSLPLLWFGVFAAPQIVETIGGLLPPAAPPLGAPVPQWSFARYAEAIGAIHAYLHNGDIYQVNLTFPCALALTHDPLAHYARLRKAQEAGWGGVINMGHSLALSCSPELFAAVRDRKIWAKPMKGTAQRFADPAQDQASAQMLANSEKDRAENLMIVDLMRNDIGRVAQIGSVVVPELFSVEAYPTIFQMTSTVRATLRLELDSVDLVRSMFPCGSITGAPKRRAREIIASIEDAPRGLYTGSIGFFAPDGSSAFNVAIRTVTMPRDGQSAMIGLGSGITVGSNAMSEWQECLAKGRFLTK